jgi:hypothetical protein
MEWFDRWFERQCRRAWENANTRDSYLVTHKGRLRTRSPIPSPDRLDSPLCNNLRIFSANGGKVVEIYHYDDKQDRTDYELYIITEGQDLGTELASIIMQNRLGGSAINV